MKENKVMKFVKEHKEEVALAAGSVVGIAAIAAAVMFNRSASTSIEFPELFSGEWTLLERTTRGKYKGCITGCVKAVDLTDLGKFGDTLATIEGIDGHEPIRIIFGTEKSFK